MYAYIYHIEIYHISELNKKRIMINLVGKESYENDTYIISDLVSNDQKKKRRKRRVNDVFVRTIYSRCISIKF